MKILGISAYYHDSAAALIEDGIPIALAQEERFTRIKHDSGFPKNAVEYCFQKAGSRDIDYVVFYEKPFIKFERFILTSLSFYPNTSAIFRKGFLSWIKEKFWIRSEISEYLNVDQKKILFVPHHLSHAASSFLCSPF
jgi:carbamoyltransferase